MKTYKLIRLSTHELGRLVIDSIYTSDIQDVQDMVTKHAFSKEHKLNHPMFSFDFKKMWEEGDLQEVSIPVYIREFSRVNPNFTIVSV